MKLIKYILIFLMGFNHLAHSQTLKFIRTDVEPAREGFVTATYIFGLDVYADNIKNCTGVTFELRHNLPEILKLSDWSYGDFGEKGSAVVIHDIDTLTKQGRLYVGVLSGEPVGFTGLDNPKLIHLEFAVSQAAPHGTELNFDVINSKAVIYDGLAGKIRDIYVPSFKYKVHGFTDVWPGDADNNGVVDTRDIATVGLYLGYGLSKENFRSFKRDNPSTFWTKQRALCWDSLEVTYADCDGNGDINITDMLIIPLNFGKVVENPNNKNKPQPIIKNNKESCDFYESNRTPIITYLPEPVIGVVARIDWKLLRNNFLCIEDNILFGSEQYSYINEHSDLYQTDFLLSSTSKSSLHQGYTTIGWVRSNISGDTQGMFELCDAKGVTSEGRIIPLKLSTTSVDDNYFSENNKNLIVSDGFLNLSIKEDNQIESIEIYDLIGSLLTKERKIYNQGQIKFDVSILASGYYYAILKFNNHNEIIKFLKI
ncbi:MAG: T9SS type A sorting domain-containing protein [Candidatus Kapabacteria bacterium]|nr:T9SS type A sorting domain-containing protein [Candidatus Kapabacteria bacterium]